MANDILEVELRITDNDAEVVLSKNKKLLKDFVDEAEKAQPNIKFKVDGAAYIDLDKLEKRTEQTRKSFEEITKVRLDKGQIGFLTKEIVKTSERARQLNSDIVSIKKELANPNRKSSIAFLTDELKAAEKEADLLDRKLNSLPTTSGAEGLVAGKSKGSHSTNRPIPNLRGYGAVFREFAPAEINEGLINSTSAMAGLAGISATTLATFGGIAAVGYGIVKITQNIREEAEKRLKLEESITGAMNRQILSQKEAITNFKELRENAAEGRDFSRFLQTDSTNQLKGRRETLEKLFSLNPTGSNAEKFKSEILDIDKTLDDIQQRNIKRSEDNFAQRNENFKKSQENAAKFEAQKLEKRNTDLKAATQKADELTKKYRETFDNLFVSTSKDNPYASIFSESDRAVDRLRENLKGLSPELKAIAEQLQAKQDSNKLFETRIDNSLDVFGLRDEANNYRFPKADSLVDKKRFEEIVQQNISQGNFFNGAFGSYGSNLANQAGGFDKLTEQQKRDIFEVATFSNLKNNPVNSQAGYSGFGANPTDFVGFLARQRNSSVDDPNAALQERLQKQIDIVDSSRANSPSELALADKKLIALTSGLDPSKLTDRERDTAASAREREAARRETAEKDAAADRKKQVELQTRIAENQEKLLELAQKEGLKGIDKLLVEIKDSPTTKSTVTRANPSDTAKQMDLSGTYFEQSQRK